ncbi:MAG: hypothetical protein U0835_17000 [Isosphaeraceae bacterium]
MASKKNKAPKRLFKAPERASRYLHDKSAHARINSVPRQHEAVLQAIETVLVKAWRHDPEVDDATCARALRACMAGSGGGTLDPRADDLVRQLALVREHLPDLPESAWRECLRLVVESVDRHSTRRPGDTAYLEFAEEFIH